MNGFRKIFSYAVCGFVLLTILACAITAHNENTKFEKENITALSENLVYCDGETVSLPYTIVAHKGECYSFSATLPEDIQEGWGIMMYSVYSDCKIYVNNRPIKTYALTQPYSFGRMTGNIRVIAKIGPEESGATLRIEVSPYYTINTDFAPILIGNIGSLQRSVISDNIFRLIIIVFLISIMLMAFGLAIYQAVMHEKRNVGIFFSFASFVLVITAWLICSSDIPQFFTNANAVVSLVSFLSLSVISIPYLAFCELVLAKGEKFFQRMQIAGWFLPVINLLGYLSNLFDPPEVVVLSHVLIVTSAAGAFVYSAKNFKSGKEAKILFAANMVILVVVGAGIGCYMIAPSQEYAANVTAVGIVTFIMVLFSLVLYRQMVNIKERKYYDTYKELAYSDFLTGLGNRAAFDRMFDDLKNNVVAGTQITLFMFDIDRLKMVNDLEGHVAGDKMIRAFADALCKTFGTDNCYRLGGDEFAVIVSGVRRTPENYLAELEKHILEEQVAVSASCGYNSKMWDRSKTFQQEIYRLADQAMYADKQRRHAASRKFTL